VQNVPEILCIPALKPWIDRGLVVFLCLYAVFGVGEIMQHVTTAVERFREKGTKRGALDVLMYGVKVMVAFGPLYISLELIDWVVSNSIRVHV